MTIDGGFRSYDLNSTVHDVDDEKHQVIVSFPHEVLDSYNTDWGRHCFRESFEKRLPTFLVNHDKNLLVGHATKAESLGATSRIVNQFSNFDDVPLARQTFAQIRDGDIPGFSFHFRNAKSIEHPSVRGARRFTRADMLENSAVTFPSIPGAVAVGIRSVGDRTASEDLQLALDTAGFDLERLKQLRTPHVSLRERRFRDREWIRDLDQLARDRRLSGHRSQHTGRPDIDVALQKLSRFNDRKVSR